MKPFWGIFSDINDKKYLVTVGNVGSSLPSSTSMDSFDSSFKYLNSFCPITDADFTGDKYILYDGRYRKFEGVMEYGTSTFEYTSTSHPSLTSTADGKVSVECYIPTDEEHTITKFGRYFGTKDDNRKFSYRHAMESTTIDGFMKLNFSCKGMLYLAISINQASTLDTTCQFKIENKSGGKTTVLDAAIPYRDRVLGNDGKTYIYPYITYVVPNSGLYEISNITAASREVTLPMYGFVFKYLYEVEYADVVSSGQYQFKLDGKWVEYVPSLHQNKGTFYTHEPNASVIEWGETPCTISTKSDGLFAPIKSRSCTLSFITDDVWDIYTASATGCEVNVYGGTTTINTSKIVFHGYLTPCMYSQGYAHEYEQIDLEAVDALSVLKYFPYKTGKTTCTIRTFRDIICDILNRVGYTNLYVPNYIASVDARTTMSVIRINEDSVDEDVLGLFSISESNFFDDDAEETAWTCEQVLEEIMKYLGWSMIPFGTCVYCIQYEKLGHAKAYQTSQYLVGIPTDVSETNFPYICMEIEQPVYIGSEHSLSYDDVYNKISINVNTYELDDITTETGDMKNWNSITDQLNLTTGSIEWKKTEWKVGSTTIGYLHQIFGLMNAKSGWTHKFYNINTGIVISNPTLPCYNAASTSEYNKTSFGINYNPFNTLGAVIQKYSFRTNGNDNSTLSWNDVIMFPEIDETKSFSTLVDFYYYCTGKRVLEYTSSEDLVFSPMSGTSWINIKGDLFYQFTRTADNATFTNLSNNQYPTAPIATTVSSLGAFTWWSNSFQLIKSSGYGGDKYEMGQTGSNAETCSVRTTENPYYKKGWKLLKCSLSIGNKSWNGSEWVTGSTTFWIRYTNNPSNGEDEQCLAFTWLKPVNTASYTDALGEDGCNIPIKPSDGVSGKLKFEMYAPAQYPYDAANMIDSYRTQQAGIINQNDQYNLTYRWGTGDLNVGTHTTIAGLSTCPTQYHIAPCVFMKDFCIKYIYGDSRAWYQKQDDTDEDVVYSNTINETYVNDFSGLELKVNSITKNKPISKSYVSNNGKYITVVANKGESWAQPQECHLIDMYCNHYSTPKFVFNCDLKLQWMPYELIAPTSENTSNDKLAKAIDGHVFAIDEQTWDLKQNRSSIKLIEI